MPCSRPVAWAHQRASLSPYVPKQWFYTPFGHSTWCLLPSSMILKHLKDFSDTGPQRCALQSNTRGCQEWQPVWNVDTETASYTESRNATPERTCVMHFKVHWTNIPKGKGMCYCVLGQHRSYKIGFIWYLLSSSGLRISLLCNPALCKAPIPHILSIKICLSVSVSARSQVWM